MVTDDRERVLSVLDVPSGTVSTHDPYGALCAMFDIAHALYWLDPNAVPAAWGFRCAPAAQDWDFAECDGPDDGGECTQHGTDCLIPRMLLNELDVNLSDPYGDDNGGHAERTLIEVGNELDVVAVLWDRS